MRLSLDDDGLSRRGAGTNLQLGLSLQVSDVQPQRRVEEQLHLSRSRG